MCIVFLLTTFLRVLTIIFSEIIQPCRLLRGITDACFVAIIGLMAYGLPSHAEEWNVGASRIDVTPTEPVRLSGYAARVKPSEGVDSSLFVRSLYLEHKKGEPLLIVSMDAIGISASMTEEICRVLQAEFGLNRAQIVLCTTHSHTAPHLEGVLTNLFADPLSSKEREASKQYTEQLLRATLKSVREAIANIESGTVSIAQDQAEFSINRRVIQSGQWANFGETPSGPVDRRVRVLSARNKAGELIAVAYQYACHCTSISPERNRVSSDWAGLSAEILERENPGLVALPIIGTGADSNPNPRGEYIHAQTHAKSMFEAVTRAIASAQKPLAAPTHISFSYAGLEFDRPAKSILQELLNDPNKHVQNRARGLLEILKVKDRIPESYPAPIHFWAFGDQLAWVFLGGEVVVDYQIRLERELSQFSDVWVAAYVDDVFAYISSERLRREGGYEVDSSMIYYNQPGPWVSGTEEKLVKAVLDLQNQTRDLQRPLDKDQALRSIRVPEGFRVEQVAAEPLIMDPINVAFGADGKVWVLEMPDYPNGGERSGRVICLEDIDRDGTLDTSKPFLSNLPFVSGVYAWRDGIVVACAPEVFFARDTDNDGEADEKRVILSGFALANPQHRVHGFTYGLDHKLHFGTGADTATVTLHRLDGTKEEFDIRGCDLAIDPDRHELTLETGETQFIRSHDGWGNWFGNDNTHPIYHYVLDRNWAKGGRRHFSGTSRYLTQPVDSPKVYPLSPALDRFNDPLTANRYTSVCSTIINLSPGNGDTMVGTALVCEPVHNLVSRMAMKRDGISWRADRLPEDSSSEWLRSDDPWFRPVRVINAPDGSIWIADMYRRVIEHPTWIPEEWLARLDVYAGKEQGRLYRVYHNTQDIRPPKELSRISEAELVELLGDENIAIADWAQQQWIWRFSDEQAAPQLISTALSSANPKIRIRAFAILNYLGRLQENELVALINDEDQRIVTYVLGQLLRGERVPTTLVQSLAKSEIPPSAVDPLLAMRIVLCLVNHGEREDKLSAKRCCDLLLEHSGISGFDLILEYADSNRIGLLVRELISRDDLRGTTCLNRLIPRMDTNELNSIMQKIADHSGTRPAWHFLMARQLGLHSNTSSLNDALIDQIYTNAREVVLSEDASAGSTIAAWELYLSRLSDDSIVAVGEVISVLPKSDSIVSEKIVSGVYRLGDNSRKILLGTVHAWPASLKSLTISLFASQPKGIESLLNEIESGRILASDVTPSQLEVIRQNAKGNLVENVVKIFGKDDSSNRGEAIERFEREWPLKVDFGPGKLLFEAHCVKCHRGGNSGGVAEAPIGPSLQALSHWTNRAWLEAIIEPGRAVDEKYKRSMIRTQEDSVLTGLIRQESETEIELVLTDGRIEKIRRSEIAEIKSSEQSLMPDGFEKSLTPEQIAQIVTYLRRGED
ncbi:MAG: neutral/alkaline non-lysosomal ceramidase N-terminal domain-containing protein [Pirellula sp.]|jgi:putative membrane-bound dehydrogenase-like protein